MAAGPDRAGVPAVAALPPGRPRGPVQVRVLINLDDPHLELRATAPISLRDLVDSLPPAAAPVLSWIPDVVLDTVGVTAGGGAVTGYAVAGRPGDDTGSADVLLAVLPGNVVLAGVQISSTVDLSGVPVVGGMLAGLGIQDLRVVYASADIPAGTVHLPLPADEPSPAYRAGFQLAFTLLSGDAAERVVVAPGSDTATDTVAGPDAVQWFPVQKSIGPLTLGRIGVRTAGGRLAVLLDATVRTTALYLDLQGFTVSFDQADISPAGIRLDLDGLGVALDTKAVKLGGSLVRTGDAYDGSLLMRLGRFGVAAAGSYTSIEGRASLFVFALATGAFGGPPAFFVTAVAAGFGYQRGLRLPPPGQAQEFPLIQAARLGDRYVPDGDPVAALGLLSAGGWVPPEAGAYWLAAGVRATSFQLLETFLLLIVRFGTELEIALLGVGALQLPKAGAGKPYAYLELVVDAVIRPAEGTVAVTATLTPNSFVIDPQCRLGGGFAFRLWLGERHTGDFVLTAGGYHPRYHRPEHYPQVPRLSVAWAMSDTLRLAGSAYFALTPSSVMAGGELDLTFRAGALGAWLRASADFLMCWRPFWFDVSIALSIGVSYTLAIGAIRRTFTTELSASVELWGPPLGGVARVNWWIISFTIPINGGVRPGGQARVLATWAEFAAAFLPAAADVCRPQIDAGLLGTVADGTAEVLLVTAAAAVLSVETAIPATEIALTGPGGSDGPLRILPGHPAGVYPLGSLRVAAPLTVTLRRADGTDADLRGWAWTGREQLMPGALWATENSGHPQQRLPEVPGLIGAAGSPPPPGTPGRLDVAWAELLTAALPPGPLPLPPRPPIDGGTPAPTVDGRDVVAGTVAAVAAVRDRLIAALRDRGIARGLRSDDLTRLARDVRREFPVPPMLGPPGTTGPRAAIRTRPRLLPAAVAGPQPVPRPPVPAPPPALVVLSRVYPTGAVTHHRGTLRGRAALDGIGAAVVLGPGGCAAWRIADGTAPRLRVRGRLPLRTVALDAQGRPLPVGDGGPVPPGTVLLAVYAPDGPAALVPLAPQAFLTAGMLIRPQAPVPQLRTRLTLRRLAEANLVESAQGVEPGWLTVTLLDRADTLTVHTDGGPVDAYALGRRRPLPVHHGSVELDGATVVQLVPRGGTMTGLDPHRPPAPAPATGLTAEVSLS
ncbi:DUF6603 domain-containing protein [Dactylosporangium sp. NPDC051541]|uniref:DUF6603 domain-containing protein n=1 Tax=Dactylosporangium sp. NPDC051541 TaxID=3363977 RepID=UPI0037A7A7CA